MEAANTLAYYDTATIAAVKRLIVQALWWLQFCWGSLAFLNISIFVASLYKFVMEENQP